MVQMKSLKKFCLFVLYFQLFAFLGFWTCEIHPSASLYSFYKKVVLRSTIASSALSNDNYDEIKQNESFYPFFYYSMITGSLAELIDSIAPLQYFRSAIPLTKVLAAVLGKSYVEYHFCKFAHSAVLKSLWHFILSQGDPMKLFERKIDTIPSTLEKCIAAILTNQLIEDFKNSLIYSASIKLWKAVLLLTEKEGRYLNIASFSLHMHSTILAEVPSEFSEILQFMMTENAFLSDTLYLFSPCLPYICFKLQASFTVHKCSMLDLLKSSRKFRFMFWKYFLDLSLVLHHAMLKFQNSAAFGIISLNEKIVEYICSELCNLYFKFKVTVYFIFFRQSTWNYYCKDYCMGGVVHQPHFRNFKNKAFVNHFRSISKISMYFAKDKGN
jgi:hypothetical protein